MFYMSIFDFEYVFAEGYLEIFHSNPDYYMTYIDTQNDTGSEYGFTFTTNQTGHIYVGIEYYSPRMYPSSCHNYTYGIGSIFTMDGTLISSSYTSDYGLFNYFEFDSLQAGTYYGKIQNFFGPLDVKDFTFRTYSSMPVTMGRLAAADLTAFTTKLMSLALSNEGLDTQFTGYVMTP